MVGSKSPWIAQAFILVLYVITLVIYSRAKKEYVGGKIGAAINLIMLFVAFLFLAAADYRLCERYGDPQLQDLAVCLMAGILSFYVCGIVSHLLELKLLWILAGLSVAIRRVAFEPHQDHWTERTGSVIMVVPPGFS